MPRLDPPVEHRFKKGRSGNPTGKKGPRLTERLRYQVEQLIETKDGAKLTYADAMVKIVLDMAIKRDLDAIKFIFDRIDWTRSSLSLTASRGRCSIGSRWRGPTAATGR
ncbi:MAG: DUF5681 domain-containing protein [Planctomycetaceae bacterium]